MDLGGHLAELKVVHRLFQDIDLHEHRVYEIIRGVDARYPQEVPLAERIVTEALNDATVRMYAQAWTIVLNAEKGGPDERNAE